MQGQGRRRLVGKSLLLTDRHLFPVWWPEGPRGTEPEQPGSPTALGAALHTGVTSRFFSMDPWAPQSGPDLEASIYSPYLCPPQPCCSPPTPLSSPRDQTASSHPLCPRSYKHVPARGRLHLLSPGPGRLPQTSVWCPLLLLYDLGSHLPAQESPP